MKREKLLKWFAAFLRQCLYLHFVKGGRFRQCCKGTGVSASESADQPYSIGNRKIESTKETAVFVQEGIKIAQVHVKAGEAVKDSRWMTLLEAVSRKH